MKYQKSCYNEEYLVAIHEYQGLQRYIEKLIKLILYSIECIRHKVVTKTAMKASLVFYFIGLKECHHQFNV